MVLQHDAEKWEAGFPKRSCSTKKLERQSIQSKAIALRPHRAMTSSGIAGAHVDERGDANGRDKPCRRAAIR
jgi:hypothetical protein